MKRPATWKVVTVGAAALGLGVIGAGTAMAEPTDALRESAAATGYDVIRVDDAGPDIIPDLGRLRGIFVR